LVARRPHSAGVDTTLSAIERDRERAGGLLAGALAHRLFLWLLPFTLVLVAGLGFLEASSKDGPQQLSDHSGIVGIASQSISRAATDAEHTRFIALFVGLPTLYFASVGAIKAFRTVSALAWGVRDDAKWNKPLAVLGSSGSSSPRSPSWSPELPFGTLPPGRAWSPRSWPSSVSSRSRTRDSGCSPDPTPHGPRCFPVLS